MQNDSTLYKVEKIGKYFYAYYLDDDKTWNCCGIGKAHEYDIINDYSLSRVA